MRQYQRKKLNKILLISAIILVILCIIVGTIVYFNSKNKEQISLYEDTVICNNYFSQIIVDFDKKEVKRDNINTNFQKEFNITEEQENIILRSQEELQNFFAGTVFEIQIKENKAYITNKYQTKKIIIQVENMIGEFSEAKVTNLQDNVYLLEYETQKQTKAAYEYLNTVDWINKVEIDEVLYIEPINDESQTVYGEQEEQKIEKYNTYGIEAMGLSNFQNIIKENGNPSEIIVSTIGYGVCIENEYFQGRINENYYNFINNSKNIQETIPQGSRVAEVIKDATTDNVKIMPLVVVNDEGYTTISTIIRAIEYSIQNSDIICYELVNKENYMINIALERAFKENKPFSCVTISKEDEQIYPANSATTIAVSSIDKKDRITTFSGRGEYIDFTAYSTDIEEIFNKNTTVSKWSGAQYSNAHIVSAMALIKTYHKEYTILELYNELRNYCKDLGEKGKDEKYGHGVPIFSNITISDIDKQAPEIKEVKFDNEKWDKIKQIQIIASDNIRLFEWAVTTSSEIPHQWNKVEGVTVTHTLDFIYEIQENGKYYIWVKDSAGNTSYMPIEVNKIDLHGPKISHEIDTTTLNTDDYVTILVKAQDEQSGLNDTPYSWDGQNWGTESTILKVTENGRYKVYVRDALGNIAEKEIKVDVFPREGIANIDEGTIIKSIVVSSSWNEDINDSVRITFNEGLNVTGWNVTTSDYVPVYFENIELEEYIEEDNIEYLEENEIDQENSDIYSENFVTEDLEQQEQGYNSSFSITQSLKAGVVYYAWIKDAYNNVKYQTFTISKVEI